MVFYIEQTPDHPPMPGPDSCLKCNLFVKRDYVRRQMTLRPPLVSIFQGEADGDGFGPQILSKTLFSMKRVYVRRQTILRPPLASIFQGEADGDGFGPQLLSKT